MGGVFKLPSRDIHKLFSKALFGNDGDKIHGFMDQPSAWLGVKHRSQRHDLNTILMLGILKGVDAAKHATGHVLLDKGVSAFENKIRKEVRNSIKNALKNL